jgi:hypothetical protein
MHEDARDLPEGVINADPAGGWQDGRTAGDTQEQSPQAQGGHQGQDGGRDTLTAGQSQHEAGLGAEQEQRLPAMSQNNASESEKVSGIVAQTRSDLAATHPEPERVVEVLSQRLSQAGIELPDQEIQELARRITTGDA